MSAQGLKTDTDGDYDNVQTKRLSVAPAPAPVRLITDHLIPHVRQEGGLRRQ